MKLCNKCKDRTAINKSKMCEICTLKQTSVKHFGKVDVWEALGEKMITQKSICPWTKIKIKLGTNASLDHDIPTSKGGPKTLENTNWTHKWFNLIMSNSDKREGYEEFKQFIKQVYENLDLGNAANVV